MLSGFAVRLNTPLAVEQLARWFHSNCWLPRFPWPLSASALELSAHVLPQATGPLNSSPNLYAHDPGTPNGVGELGEEVEDVDVGDGLGDVGEAVGEDVGVAEADGDGDGMVFDPTVKVAFGLRFFHAPFFRYANQYV